MDFGDLKLTKIQSGSWSSLFDYHAFTTVKESKSEPIFFSESSRTFLLLAKSFPDEHFRNFSASRSGDRRVISSSGTSCDGFWSCKIVKRFVGFERVWLYYLFLFFFFLPLFLETLSLHVEGIVSWSILIVPDLTFYYYGASKLDGWRFLTTWNSWIVWLWKLKSVRPGLSRRDCLHAEDTRPDRPFHNFSAFRSGDRRSS